MHDMTPSFDPTLRNARGTARAVLTLAMSEYDHVRDLTTGDVTAEGIDLNYLKLSIEEIFYRFTRFREWDVSEMSMGKYVSLISQNDLSLTAIPVFPSRMFRHSSIYVLRDGPVREPKDLAGRRVGVPEWAQTASIYTRGALTHQFGLALQDIEWIQAGVNQPGRIEKVLLRLPNGVRYKPAPTETLNGMLLDGKVDAVMTAHPPDAFKAGDPRVIRLFANAREVELAYWRQTQVFPIMHTVAIRREVFDRHPWIAANLFKAFEQAKERSVQRALEITATRFPVPWIAESTADARAIFGDDFWPYGVEPNRRTLETFLAYAHEQGVCHRPVAVEELFPPTVLSSFKV